VPTPTTGYCVSISTAGRPSALGAASVSFTPFGRLMSVHFMSTAHSIIRPAMTVLSAARRSTAVQARAGQTELARAKDVTSVHSMPCFSKPPGGPALL